MAVQLVTIQQAAKMSQKSTQTIRRLIKMNKLKCKRKRTPQGFNYEVERGSLVKYFALDFVEEEIKDNGKNVKENDVFELRVEPDTVRSKRRKKSTIYDIAIPVETADVGTKEDVLEGISIEETVDSAKPAAAEEGQASATKEALRFASVLQQVLKQHQEDKDRLFSLVEQFQKRTLILEERIRRLEGPKRSWWRLW